MVGEFATREVREWIMFRTAFMSPEEIKTCMQKSALFHLLDFYRATEHLSKAAEAIFGKKSIHGKAWYCKWEERLKYGKTGVQGLINPIKYHQAQTPGMTSKESLQKELTFFTRNAGRMDYKTFLERALPIGSEPVEAGCKTIVKQRMYRSGQRCSLKEAHHVLHLRSIVTSNRWDIYWNELVEIRLAS